MNLTITRQNLQKGLAAVSATIPARTTLPVLSHVLLETDGGELWFSGTDLDVSIRVKVPATVKEEGAITIPGKTLQSLARQLAEQPIEVRSRGQQVEIRCWNSRFKLNGLPSEEFPNLPAIEFEEGWKVPAAELLQLIRATSFAVSTEDSRPILNGVLWELDDDRMSMVATNGHRLARMGTPVTATGADRANLIVPPGALGHVARLFEGSDEVTVARNGNHLGFSSGEREVFTRLIDGKYPNYEQVIPKDNDKIGRVKREVMEAAVRRMAVMASDTTRRVKLSFEAGRVRLDVVTPDLGEAHDEVELEFDGDGIAIGFNASYLLEVLRNMPAEEIRMSFKTPERAAILQPADSDLDCLCLVMPLRLVD